VFPHPALSRGDGASGPGEVVEDGRCWRWREGVRGGPWESFCGDRGRDFFCGFAVEDPCAVAEKIREFGLDGREVGAVVILGVEGLAGLREDGEALVERAVFELRMQHDGVGRGAVEGADGAAEFAVLPRLMPRARVAGSLFRSHGPPEPQAAAWGDGTSGLLATVCDAGGNVGGMVGSPQHVVKARVVLEVDNAEQLRQFERWCHAAGVDIDRLDDEGCGCCVNIYTLQASKDALRALNDALHRCGSGLEYLTDEA